MESAVEQICREAGARVSTNVMVRDLDIAHSHTDARRFEVVAEGVSVFGGVQLALDATLVSAHHGLGTPLRKADKIDGVALQHARKRKEHRYPELCGLNGRTRLVVIAGRGGRTVVSRNPGIPAKRVTWEGAVSTPHLEGERTGRGTGDGAVCWRAQPPKRWRLEKRGDPCARGSRGCAA